MSRQLALGDLDPLWHDWDQLCARDAAEPDIDPRWRDIRHQGLTADQYRRIVDVPVVGNYL
ncbi:hypothetical protein GTY41_03610 [Streptomyces sp. SID685]|uniref:hypothetical protein n=1 Tax=Streptomyces sp. SID685 TaxID=2690322 RepID=UPI00136CD28B|nr:hypothetical protein [Streptomyces sp. SID685]MYR84052.1 hypothetical protein [Streptomyces sp. SID685]